MELKPLSAIPNIELNLMKTKLLKWFVMLLKTYLRNNCYGRVVKQKALVNEAFKIKYRQYMFVSENVVVTLLSTSDTN